MSDSSGAERRGDGQPTAGTAGSAGPVDPAEGGGEEHRSGDLSTLVGLAVQVAVTEVERMGLQPRVIDESVQAITAEYSSRRVNLHVVGGVVRRATAG